MTEEHKTITKDGEDIFFNIVARHQTRRGAGYPRSLDRKRFERRRGPAASSEVWTQ